MAISYIICAAGEGKRFKSISQNKSKPFLMLNGVTLFERSIQSLLLEKNDQVVLLHRFSDKEEIFFNEKIAPKISCSVIGVRLHKLTRGQAETSLYAKDIIKNNQIAIFNIDTYFKSTSMVKMMNDESWDGVVPCFKASGDSWSFFKVIEKDFALQVIEATEKVRISPWASVGLYYFKNAEEYFQIVEEELSKGVVGELYIAPLYNKLVLSKKRICVVDCEEFKPMGTVDQVKDFWHVSEESFRRENGN